MELVDANTKNFVFLTLSQYNDKEKLVRTRVSMRRDQPFWDGGNSFICCESFRVTSSPSQGGLYYKIFPPEWFMGCSIARDDQSQIPQDDDWVSLNLPWVSDTADQHGKQCATANAEFDHTEMVSTGQIYTADLAQNGDVDTFNTSDPTLIQTYLAKWVNQYHLTKGAWIRIQMPSGETGQDGQNPGYFSGRLSTHPSSTMSGNGYGPSRLYYARLQVNTIGPKLNAVLGMFTALAVAGVHATSVKFPLTMLMRAQPNFPDTTTVTGIEMDIFNKALGTGMILQLRTKGDAPRLWDLPIYGSFFRVMGVQGVTYNFQKRFFSGDNQDIAVGHQAGAPLAPMHFTEFKVGSACWLDIEGNNPHQLTAGRYWGTILAIPTFEREDGYWAYPLHLEGSDNLQTVIRPMGVNNRTSLIQQDFAATYDDTQIALGITCNTQFVVQQDYNMGPVDGVEANPNANPPVLAVDSFWDFDTGMVWYAPNSHSAEIMCIRKPGEEGPKYMYTPNEMFFAFNKPEPGIGNLPYKLQTDENGGFVIRWDDSEANPGTDFIISCDLSKELGLNEYFEYDNESFLGHVDKDQFFLLKYSREPWLEDQQITTWLPRAELSTSDSVWTPAPPQPTQNGAFGQGPDLWDRQGQKYAYITNHQYSRDRYENSITRIYPVIHTDENGVEFFSYNDLPVIGRIGNTQMVSVESFSTYSEITIVIPNLPFQSMLGTSSDSRILASLRLPFINGTANDFNGEVTNTTFSYYGDLIFNTLSSRSYLKVTTDQQLYDCDVEVRLIRRDGQMDVMKLPYKGEFQVKLRMLQTQ